MRNTSQASWPADSPSAKDYNFTVISGPLTISQIQRRIYIIISKECNFSHFACFSIRNKGPPVQTILENCVKRDWSVIKICSVCVSYKQLSTWWYAQEDMTAKRKHILSIRNKRWTATKENLKWARRLANMESDQLRVSNRGINRILQTFTGNTKNFGRHSKLLGKTQRGWSTAKLVHCCRTKFFLGWKELACASVLWYSWAQSEILKYLWSVTVGRVRCSGNFKRAGGVGNVGFSWHKPIWKYKFDESIHEER